VATCRAIIRQAMQITGVLGRREPDTDEADSGLAALQSLYDEWIGEGRFGRLINKLVDESPYEAQENERVAYSGSGSLSVTMPATITTGPSPSYPEYGSETVAATTPRTPRDCSVIVVVGLDDDENEQAFLYEANRGAWVDLKALALGDYAPLSSRGQYGLASCLAKKIASYDGQGVPAQAEAAALRFMGALSDRFGSQREVQQASYY
jgi:hypothetical protein